MSDGTKLLELERRTDAITRRLDRLEASLVEKPPAPVRQAPPERVTAPPSPALRPVTAVPGPRAAAAASPAPAPVRPGARAAPAPPPARQGAGVSLEDVLAGRVLAWAGGIATLLGLAFLLAIAVSHGWIGELERTLAAAAASGALVLLGVRLHDRAGRTDASLAAVSSGIAGAFATIVVATQVYGLTPLVAGTAAAVATGGLATMLAIRWRSQGIAALGVLGALASPVLVGAPSDAGTLSFLFVAGLSAAGVLVWQRWDWLGLAAFAVITPQWVAWLLGSPTPAGAVVVLVLFGALGAACAIGFELRLPAATLRSSSAFLLALNACVLGGVGWLAMDQAGERSAADLWLAGLAAAHIVVGAASARLSRVSAEIRLLTLALGVALADIAFGVIASGPLLVAGWAGSAGLFAWIARRSSAGEPAEGTALLGLGTHVGLALAHALVHDAPPDVLLDGRLTAAGVVALAALAAGCFVSGRLAGERDELRVALDVLGLAAVAYLAALALDGPQLAVAWALEATALGQLSRRTGDRVAASAALAHLGGAALHMLAFEAPPVALVTGVEDQLGTAIAAGAVAVAALRLAQLGLGRPEWRPALGGAAGATLLYLASVELVTPFQPDAGTAPYALFELGPRQHGQVLLSALWSTAGVGALLVGLRRDLRPVRLAGLSLLLVTVAKVFLYDLAALTSLYRVASFVGLGVLLLTAAFVWQRARPRPLPDLRNAPPAVR